VVVVLASKQDAIRGRSEERRGRGSSKVGTLKPREGGSSSPRMAVLDGEARVLMTAQHIIKALGTSDAMTDDMISVLSKFDHRFSIMNDSKNLERRGSSDASTSHHGGGHDSDSDPEPGKRRVMNSALDAAEKVIVQWDLGEQGARWIFEGTTEDSQTYLDAVDEVLTELESMKIHNRDPKLLEEAQHLLQLAMERLEEELRHVLERYTGFVDPDVLINSFSNGSFRDPEPEEVDDEDEDEEDEQEGVSSSSRGRTLERTQSRAVPLLPAQAAEDVLGIVTRLIAGGFKKECVQVYISSRKQVLERSLQALGVERLSIDEVQKMPWELQEEKIKKWNQAMKVGVTVLFASEKQLCDQVWAQSLRTFQLLSTKNLCL
jgi:exocyst complex protein 7